MEWPSEKWMEAPWYLCEKPRLGGTVVQDRGRGSVPVQYSWEKIAPVVKLCFHWRELQQSLGSSYVEDGVRSVQLAMAC